MSNTDDFIVIIKKMVDEDDIDGLKRVVNITFDLVKGFLDKTTIVSEGKLQ